MPQATQSAQTVLLNTISSLIKEDKIDEALDAFEALNDQAKADLGDDILLVTANYRSASREYNIRQAISFEEFSRYKARTRAALVELMKDVPRRMQTTAQVRNLNTFQFEVPDDARLEKIIGPRNNLLKINWLEKALQASKAVCRVVRADGGLGTGFLTADGYIYTNNHVLPDQQTAASARIEFNYEQDVNGKIKSRSNYQLDAKDFLTSTPDKLDFARVKVIDDPTNPLRQWGFVEIDPSVIPSVGDPLTIIQHPLGQDKQIALNSNDVLSVWNQHVFYLTDTDEGSSGSPVFNSDWKVVAIHHAGKGEKEGGIQIKPDGTKAPANRGILFNTIDKALKGQNVQAAAPQGGRNESFTPPPSTPIATGLESVTTPATAPSIPQTPVSTPQPAPPPPQPTISNQQSTISTPSAGPVRFVVLYDEADAPRLDLLLRQLSVTIKITKKMVVYDVHKQVGGGEKEASAEPEIAQADYVLCLVSPNLLNGEATWLVRALTAKEEGHRVIPILLDHASGFNETDLSKLATLPTRSRTVIDFPNPEAAYADIAGELKKLPKRV